LMMYHASTDEMHDQYPTRLIVYALRMMMVMQLLIDLVVIINHYGNHRL
jgi:hypothetical protein